MKINLLVVSTLLLLAGLFSVADNARAQIVAQDLSALLRNGSVALVSATGTGASSGGSVVGILENTTANKLYINVYLAKPIFLTNRGKGQNMIAGEVYQAGGAFQSDGRQSFITLSPRAPSRVMFIAYCADFEKDNPTSQETFSIGTTPQAMEKVMANITKYAGRYPHADITVPAQVAVWLVQGVPQSMIAEKFPFSARDEQLARSFLK